MRILAYILVALGWVVLIIAGSLTVLDGIQVSLIALGFFLSAVVVMLKDTSAILRMLHREDKQ